MIYLYLLIIEKTPSQPPRGEESAPSDKEMVELACYIETIGNIETKRLFEALITIN